MPTLKHLRTSSPAAPTATSLSLAPYAGPFDRPLAWHLLRRATFGATSQRVDEALELGLEASLDRLVTDDAFDAKPLNAFGTGDPNVPIGETWITAPYAQGFDVNPYRQVSLQAWQLTSYRLGGFSAQASMSLFWHNHFAVSRDNADARLFYNYLARLRRHALGNVRTLVTEIVTDGAMLRFLNGNENVAGDPNENFARELLELFTLGKGPLAGAGDYTNYTEQDVRELARALTGWTVRGINSTNPDSQPEAVFIAQRHDTGVKQLSPRLGSASIPNEGAAEYERVLDVVFDQPGMGEHIVRKLYRWFVYYEIPPEVESEVIAPLTAQLQAGGFEVAPVLRTLLGSEHFFAMHRRSAMIKSPIHFTFDVLAALGTPIPTQFRVEQFAMTSLRDSCADQQQIPSQPPSVAGWKAYYQAPLYARTWISSTTLAARERLTDMLTTQGWEVGQQVIEADLLGLIAEFENPSDPTAVVEGFAERMLPEPLTEAQLGALKEVLLGGQPDFEWTVEYNQHLGDPGDEGLARGLENKLRLLARTLLTTAEAHLC